MSTVTVLPYARALEDLERSGLGEKDFKLLKLEALSSDETYTLTQKYKARSLKLPYFDRSGRPLEGAFRLRFLDDVRGFGARKPLKYWQPGGTEPHVYLPPYLDWGTALVDPAVELWVTEGEKKAAAACKAGVPTIGLGGVWNWRSTKARQPLIADLAVIAWRGRRVVLAFDTDADPNPLVVGALEMLGHTLEQRGARVGVLKLPLLDDADKTGVDDYLVARGVAELKALEVSALSSGVELARLNDELTVISTPSALLHLPTGALYVTPRPLIDLHYAHRRVTGVDAAGRLTELNAVSEWLRWPHHRVAPGVAFEPGKPRVLDDGRVNLWAGWPVEPKRGDVSLFIRLVDYLFSAVDKTLKRWFIQWLAYPIAHPGTKLYTAPIFWSRDTGTGKSLLGYTMGRVYGPAFTVVSEAELHGAFNSWQVKRQFVMGEEISGSDRRIEANRLKHLITGETVRVNCKYQAEYDVRNCVNFLFTSNQPDAFSLEDRDRRYFVHCIDPAAGKRPPDAWFSQTYDPWYKTDPAAGPALMHYLLNVDLTGFDPYGRAPETADRAEMISVSGSDADRVARDLRDAPDAVLRIGEAVVARDLFTLDEILTFVDPTGRYRIGPQGLARALGRAGFTALAQTKIGKTSLVRLWAVRNRERWAAASHAERAAHYTGAGEKSQRVVKF